MPAAHKPTDETRKTVKALATHGITQDEIAQYIGVDKKTLTKYYEVELAEIEKFQTKVTAHLRQRIFKNDILLMFYAKTQMGYRETGDAERERKPLEINFRMTAQGERMSREEEDEE